MFTKSMVIKEMDDKGNGVAQLAQLSAVDSDNDTYVAGAFSWKQGGGQWTQMIPAHDRKAMPFGKSWLYEKGDYALADFSLNLDTVAGREWHAALKFDLAKGDPIQEWSYGFQVLDADFQQRGPDKVRVLKRLDVDEISPVIRGAGTGTRTLAIKSAALKGVRFSELIAGLGELADVVKADPALLSAIGVKQLGDIHAALGLSLDSFKTGTACAGCEKKFPPEEMDGDRCKGCAGKSTSVDTALAGYLMHMSRRHLGA